MPPLDADFSVLCTLTIGYIWKMSPRISSTAVGQVAKVFRFESIKSRIVGLALAATLIPSLAMAWVSYAQNRAALTDKINEELQSVSAQTARELDLWFKERLFDVRVFATSDAVYNNIVLARRTDGGGQTSDRLHNYLSLVEDTSPDFTELIVVDQQGRTLATSADGAGDVHLPSGWLDRVASGEVVIADAYFDEELGQSLMTVAVPVNAADLAFVGAFVANVTYRAVQNILLVFAPGDSGNLYVIAPDGTTILSLRTDTRPFADRKLSPATTQLLFASEGRPSTHVDLAGNEVLSTLKRVQSLDWAVVADIPTEEAYAQVVQLRDMTALLVVGLLVVVGFIAYWLGLLIVRPLDRLTRGAAEVASGDLAVDLPVGRGEVGYLTEVFNGMVERLHTARQQLEQLLVTDELTGISNRRHLEETLKSEIRRSRRSKRSFSVLMADIDRFKEFNDTHGHLAGDEALKAVAQVLRKTMRDEDYVARYGGEEFLVMLPDTDLNGAVRAAERVREGLDKISVSVGKQSIKLTVSTGVAEFPTHGDSPESLIASADEALYQAKRSGRDRVVPASRRRGTTAATATRTKKSTSSTTNSKKSTNSKRTKSNSKGTSSKRANSANSNSTNSKTTKSTNPKTTKAKSVKPGISNPKATKPKTTKKIKVAS